GWDDLDPAVLAPRPLPPVLGPGLGGLQREVPPRDPADLTGGTTVRFDCLNVFANGPVDFPIPDAPAPGRDLHIRFFPPLPRPRWRSYATCTFDSSPRSRDRGTRSGTRRCSSGRRTSPEAEPSTSTRRRRTSRCSSSSWTPTATSCGAAAARRTCRGSTRGGW